MGSGSLCCPANNNDNTNPNGMDCMLSQPKNEETNFAYKKLDSIPKIKIIHPIKKETEDNINEDILKNQMDQSFLINASSFSYQTKNPNNFSFSILEITDDKKDLIENLFKICPQDNNDLEIKHLQYSNGDEYYGEYDPIKREKIGRGIMFFRKKIYYGYWEHNKMNGKGKMIYNNFFEKKELKITFDDENIPYYIGNWVNGFQNGEGKEKIEGKWLYEGNFKDGHRDGNGKLFFPDGSKYIGQFNQGMLQGKGIMTYSDGRIYDGNWVNNKMNGKGEFKWPDGRKYVGYYCNNLKSGYGEFFWPNGKIYMGQWENGKQNGEGKLINKNIKIMIVGIWKDGKKIKFQKVSTDE